MWKKDLQKSVMKFGKHYTAVTFVFKLVGVYMSNPSRVKWNKTSQYHFLI